VSAEVIDIRTILAVRDMSDWRIQNFLWYFDNYKHSHWKSEVRDMLEGACRKEAERRGIFSDGKLKIGE
jgi:hypothetical protein